MIDNAVCSHLASPRFANWTGTGVALFVADPPKYNFNVSKICQIWKISTQKYWTNHSIKKMDLGCLNPV